MSYSEEDIFNHTKDLMVNMFEIEEDKVNLESHLYDDLEIDSIDAIDLIVELKNKTGAKIEQEDFREVRTIQDVVSTVHKLLHAGQTG